MLTDSAGSVRRLGVGLLALIGLLLTGCGREDAVKEIWSKYNKAWKDKDIEALKESVTADHASDIAGLTNPESVFAAGEAYHPSFIMLGQPQFSDDGQEAECAGLAKRDGKSIGGSVGFVLEDGVWKVVGEHWDPPRK